MYAFYRYAKSPSINRIVWIGLCDGLALASKHTAILLFPIILILLLTEIFRTFRTASPVKRAGEERWFVYFAEGVIDTTYYGIPCKQLPTADSLWIGGPADAPASINGTFLISAGNLSGYEFAPGALNPYKQSKSLTPKAVIA